MSSTIGLYIHPRYGNVGIGTTNPTSSLHIPNETRLNGINIQKIDNTQYAINNWITRSIGTFTQLSSVCWSSNLNRFAAVDNSGSHGDTIALSSDGINWSGRGIVYPLGGANYGGFIWNSVCYSPEKNLFCAVGDYISVFPSLRNANIIISSNASVWYTRQTPTNDDWKSVCWSSNLSLFAAIANTTPGKGAIMTSPTGDIWNSNTGTGVSTRGWSSICWSPQVGLFCAVAQANASGYAVVTSSNGTTWTSRATPANYTWNSVCWSPELSLFCAVASTGYPNMVMTSPNGISWNLQTVPINNSWNSVCWSSQLYRFCAIGASGVNNGNMIMTSSDGITWRTRITPSVADSTTWQGICWSPEKNIFVGVGSATYTSRVLTSVDYSSNPTLLTIDTLGNIGIGTTIPNSHLDIRTIPITINNNLNVSGNVSISGKLLGKYGYAILEDQKPSGTEGGASTAGVWHPRTLNTVVADTIGIPISASSNQFTLYPGTYDIHASVPAYASSRHRVALSNIDAFTIDGLGLSTYSTANNGHYRSYLDTILTVTTNTRYVLYHYIQTQRATNALGAATSSGYNELYSRVIIKKLL